MKDDLFNRATKTSTILIKIISNGVVIERKRIADVGQMWYQSKKLDMAQLLPARKCGIQEGLTTEFYYNAGNPFPLTFEDISSMGEDNQQYLYGINSEQEIVKYLHRTVKNKKELLEISPNTVKLVPLKLTPTSIDSQTLRHILKTHIIDDLIRNYVDIWESLKVPIIIGILAAVVIFFMFLY
jgi:hypothetical protein